MKKSNPLKGRFKRLTPIGEKFGQLTVVGDGIHSEFPNGKTKRMVKVTCDCGVTCEKQFTYVVSGHTKSCGTCLPHSPPKDLVGLSLGQLTIERYSGRDETGKHSWVCNCSCGGSVVFPSDRLNRGNVYNCGECATSVQSNAVYLKELEPITNSEGCVGTPIGFNKGSLNNLKVQFDDENGTVITTTLNYFKRGLFKNPNHPTVQGVGYYGEGNFVSKRGEVHTPEYSNWRSMLARCYSGRYASYENTSVCEEWHNFQVFAEWATKQIGFGVAGWQLDKDLLSNEEKVYSPLTCCYLPSEVNGFIKRERLNDLPLGVDRHYSDKGVCSYRAQGRENGNNVSLGWNHSSPSEAFLSYKAHKERLARQLADKWESMLDQKAYKGLLNFTLKEED